MRFFLPITLLLAACGSQPEPSQDSSDPLAGIQIPPPPAQLCAQAGETLEKLGAKGAIDYDDRGTATVPQELWMAMGAGHSSFAQVLALHAACAHPDGTGDRKVVIRNESGVVLMEASVPTTSDLGALSDE